MTIYKPRHSLLLNYNKICPICYREFYSKNINVKYCSETCSNTARKQGQAIASAKYRKKLIGELK